MREADETLKERHVVRAGVRFFFVWLSRKSDFLPGKSEQAAAHLLCSLMY